MVNLTIENGQIIFGDKSLNILVSFFGEKKVESIVDGGELGKLDISIDYDNFLLSAVVFKENDGKYDLEIVNLLNIYDYFKLYNNDLILFDNKNNFISLENNISSINKHITDNFNVLMENVSNIYGSVNTIYNKVDAPISSVLSNTGQILNELDNLNIDLSPVTSKLDDIKSYLESMDLDKVVGKLNNIFNVVSAMNNALDVSTLLDEKLSNILAMVSLNGSNGAKFKDGDKVLVKGYIGDWQVLSSHIILTAENTNTIVYQVKQGNRIMLVPASFVTQGD